MAGVNGISLSGSFLSSLLFKLKNAPGDSVSVALLCFSSCQSSALQEGFLFGKVHSHQVDNITDSQSTGRKEERKICLHSFISFNKKHRWVHVSYGWQRTMIHMHTQFLQSWHQPWSCQHRGDAWKPVPGSEFVQWEIVRSTQYILLQDVIGWFSYRRNSSHRLSLKEKTLHCKLAKIFKHLQSKGEMIGYLCHHKLLY